MRVSGGVFLIKLLLKKWTFVAKIWVAFYSNLPTLTIIDFPKNYKNGFWVLQCCPVCASIEVSCFDASGHAQKIAFYFTSRPTTHRKWMAYLVLWWVKTSSPTTYYLLHHHREFRVMPRGLFGWPVWRVRSIFQSKAFILLLPLTTYQTIPNHHNCLLACTSEKHIKTSSSS